MKGRIIGVDYGKARIGLATTDPDQIIVSGLETINARDFKAFIGQYCTHENVVKVVFGKPIHKDGSPTYLWEDIQNEVKYLYKKFPEIEIDYEAEEFTSVQAKQILLQSAKKKKRRDKNSIDKVSAILILQKYLGHI